MKVYVAGAGSEMSTRAVPMIRRIQSAGFCVTYDWTEVHLGPEEHKAPKDIRIQASIDDLRGVDEADCVVALLPWSGFHSIGLWVELGYAIARHKHIFACGDAERTIFTERVTRIFATDDELFEEVQRVGVRLCGFER